MAANWKAHHALPFPPPPTFHQTPCWCGPQGNAAHCVVRWFQCCAPLPFPHRYAAIHEGYSSQSITAHVHTQHKEPQHYKCPSKPRRPTQLPHPRHCTNASWRPPLDHHCSRHGTHYHCGSASRRPQVHPQGRPRHHAQREPLGHRQCRQWSRVQGHHCCSCPPQQQPPGAAHHRHRVWTGAQPRT